MRLGYFCDQLRLLAQQMPYALIERWEQASNGAFMIYLASGRIVTIDPEQKREEGGTDAVAPV